MIKLEKIYKSYGSLQVLSDVSLTIGKNEIVTIVGPSGAGKTTLLQIAGTLDKPDFGTISYDGQEILGFNDKRLSAFRNKNIGFIFQFHQLLPEFTAQENVALPAMIGGMSKRKAMDKAAQLLDMLGLADRRTHKPAQMSGGERQRTAIARALVNDPEVIFADEPTGSLDSRNRDEITAIIADLRKKLGRTFVIVTHDPYMTTIADRVITMADGRIVSEESTAPEPPVASTMLNDAMDEVFGTATGQELACESSEFPDSENNC